MQPEILQIGPLLPETMHALEETYRVHRYDLAPDKDALLREIAPRVTAIATRGDYALRGETMARLPLLKLIASSGAGYDGIEASAARRMGIAVTHTPGIVSECVADMAWALMLATVRRVLFHDRFVRSGTWLREKPMLTDRVWGQRLGIVGLGGIGKAIARRAEAFRMEVAYCGRRQQPGVAYRYFDDVRDLAAFAQILVVAVPGGVATSGLVGREAIDALGAGAYLVNVSRGSVVDEPYLIDALQNKRLAGAGLDVFANEPHVPDALIAMENVVLQPHMGSGSNYTRIAMGQLLLDNLAAFFDGRPLLSPVP
ncbi:2-hydroxyacid dehydrogenase [Bosea sp. (in: a-proteobacteria)]|uniref:2-hydroxyacid dehydrogenase n=1 Tax=Bosea sp. (in: a-proteobacteria) TaxID=1871050 RepID=UPI002FC7DE83